VGKVTHEKIATLSPQDLISRVCSSGVLHFRNQQIEIDDFAVVAARFGTIKKLDHLRPSARKDLSLVEHVAGTPIRERRWHSDLSWLHSPPTYTLLNVTSAPDRGGLLFARSRVPNSLITVLSRFAGEELCSMRVAYSRRTNESQEPALHPIVLRTGDKESDIYLSPLYERGVVGLSARESQKVLSTLLEYITRESRVFYADVRPGDILIWNNRIVVHKGSAEYDPGVGRTMVRATVFTDTDGAQR